MDSLEINKGVAAVLVAGIVFFLTGTVGTILVQEHTTQETGDQGRSPRGRLAVRSARP